MGDDPGRMGGAAWLWLTAPQRVPGQGARLIPGDCILLSAGSVKGDIDNLE